MHQLIENRRLKFCSVARAFRFPSSRATRDDLLATRYRAMQPQGPHAMPMRALQTVIRSTNQPSPPQISAAWILDQSGRISVCTGIFHSRLARTRDCVSFSRCLFA